MLRRIKLAVKAASEAYRAYTLHMVALEKSQ